MIFRIILLWSPALHNGQWGSIEQHENIVILLEKNDQKNAIDAMLHHIRRPEFDGSRITNEYPEFFQHEDTDKKGIPAGNTVNSA